jgi:histidine triad (HIT) family protein
MRSRTRRGERAGEVMGVSDCPFCARIAAGEYDDDLRRFDAVSFEPLNPVTEGHRLVVPKIHVSSALGYPAITADVMAAAVAVAQQRGVAECNFITSAGAAATQTIRHLHLHIVPRREGDGLALPWTGQVREVR